MDVYQKIKIIAESARIWAQAYAKVKKFPEDLNGMCAIASAKLFEMLDREIGLNPSIVVWHDSKSNGVHCFVICNQYLVDITATQFGNFSNVEIVNTLNIDKKRFYFWNYDTVLKSVDDLMLYQQHTPWIDKSQVTIKSLSWRSRG